MTGRIAVGVSGAGSNLRAVAAAAERGELGGSIVLVFADRACPAIDWAIEQGLDTAIVPAPVLSAGSGRADWDRTLAETLSAVRPDVVVLAGFMRVLGPAVLAAFPDRIVNTHPALAPAFPGARAVADAVARGARLSGVTVHLVDATLDGGPILLQEAVAVLPADDAASLHERIRAVEHQLLPRAVGLLLAGAVEVADGRVTLDIERAESRLPVPRRALLSVSDKTGLEAFGRALVSLGFELVSTGGSAAALRAGGLPVTDVAALTGVPEMLDGRVKTLHPRVHAGILADRRRIDHRRQLVAAGIAPFELVVINLYPFAAAADRPGIGFDELVEEIDIGGPSLIRAAAKNHASVAVVTAPARYPAVLEALAQPADLSAGLRAALAVEAFRHTAGYDARIAATLPERMAAAGIGLPDEPGLPGATDPYPATLTLGLEKVETLRYGENPHQPAARYRIPGSSVTSGPFAASGTPLQGKALSYNNVLDSSAAAALARSLRGPGCVIVKHTNPCGAAERATLLEAWQAALSGDPVSAFGGVVALTMPVDEEVARALAAIFLEVIVAPAFEPAALAILAGRANLRLIVDPGLGAAAERAPAADPIGSVRIVGGAVLVTSRDDAVDDPAGWTVATRRSPTPTEALDLDLAWRLVRGATSNAIVLVKDRRLVGLGSGQTSRVDAAKQAVGKAQAISGVDATLGAACASDAYFPFADGVEACLAAGVSAFVQPGGSIRDPEVIAAADGAGATMVLTGVRHFRH
jgi:phosphoribosylaminoimidazolecarboxamide formyltransferase / IMP cyclohydrolase